MKWLSKVFWAETGSSRARFYSQAVATIRHIGEVESQYFTIGRTVPCWEHIMQTRTVGMYAPVAFT